MNKRVLILLALVLAISLITVACGEKTDQPQADKTEQPIADNTAQEAGDKTEKEEPITVKESLNIDYDNMTEEDLIKELIADTNNITVDEYLNFLESYKYAKTDNFEESLAIKNEKTFKALTILMGENAVFPDKTETLVKALQSPEPVVRGKVLFDVSSSIREDANLMNMLLDLGQTEEDPYVLDRLADTFRYYMGNPEVAEFMFKMSKHEHPVIRSSAILGISDSEGVDGSLERLIEMLDDEDETVRKTAYRGIGDLGDEGAIDPIVAVLMDPDKTDYHQDCMESLVQLWLAPPFYKGESEKAYNATLEYLNYTPRSKNMPYFKAINYINGAKRTNDKDIENFNEWAAKSTYYNSNDLIKPMFEIAKDPEIYHLACKYAIEVVNLYGTKEQFEDLKPVLESSAHPEKEGILEEYNKIVEKNK